MSAGAGTAALAAPVTSKQRLRLWLRLLRTARYMENQLRERLRVDYGATLPRFDVMAALYRMADGLTMGELSRMLMVSNGNVTGIVERLVSEGYVRRRPIEGDRRAIRVELTTAGHDLFEIMAAEHEGWVDHLLRDITAEEAGRMIAILSRVKRGERE